MREKAKNGPRPRPTNRPGPSSIPNARRTEDLVMDNSDSKSYETARRQIVLTPAKASLEEVRAFMMEKLCMEEEMVENTQDVPNQEGKKEWRRQG